MKKKNGHNFSKRLHITLYSVGLYTGKCVNLPYIVYNFLLDSTSKGSDPMPPII